MIKFFSIFGLTVTKSEYSRSFSTALSDEVDSRMRSDQNQMSLISQLRHELDLEKERNKVLEERLNNFIEEEQVLALKLTVECINLFF